MKQFIISLLVAITLSSDQRANGQFGGAASTPEALAGHAVADMIRSEGMYNQMTSAAMVNFEDARGRYIENQRKLTDLYLMRKRILAAQHAEAIAAARARNYRLAQTGALYPSHSPHRLTSSQLDPQTQKVTWPSALLRDTFISQREDIESLLSRRSHESSSSELSSALYEKIREMQDVLRLHIREIVTSEYLEARRFLASLLLESTPQM